jgi:hypothetical protein
LLASSTNVDGAARRRFFMGRMDPADGPSIDAGVVIGHDSPAPG